MSVIRKSKRPRHQKRRLDLSAMKEVLRDDRLWHARGKVVRGEDVQSWFIDEGDILVEVQLVPSEIEILAFLGSIAAGGFWAITPVGTDVVVAFPDDGEIECEPILFATFSSGDVPNPPGEGPTETQLVIARASVLIHDGAGGTKALATEDHKHELPPLVGASYGAGGSGIDTFGASDDNTTVLKAK